ncbi:MAG: hypothetical protein ABIF85_02080 [Nanoarchaeota archaeon]|nr:hypothetical protein [Nanoarchaeota archaeon]MBU4300868.1 hypothetical protein [Nanoarchaeota archaeon]MBU4451426.1 hypothetical protein [Nanoarchaeota archaeon]MCG2724500.1 hypothetical protein [archaeon]
MSDSDSGHSERKIAALLLIAVVAGAIGIYSYGQEHPESMDSFSSVFKSITLPTGFAIFGSEKSEELVIDAELIFDMPPTAEAEIKSPAESILISFANPNNTFIIENTPWQYPSKTEIILKNYTGKIGISAPTSIKGIAKGVTVNSATIPYSDKSISVSASSFAFDYIAFNNVLGLNLELKNISGTIKAKNSKNSAVYTVSNSILSLSSFSGDITYYGTKLILQGSGKIDTELLGVKK